MSDDTRPLIVRVRNLAARFGAMAIGADKTPHLSRQVGENHRRDARTLHDAYERIKALEELLNHAEDLFDWAAQSDCENGVRSLNEAAAVTYLTDAPATKAAILEIRELTRALLKEADQ